MNRKKVLVVATTAIGRDGLTAVLERTAQAAAENCDVSFALAETPEPDAEKQLKKMGAVYRLPSRKRKLPVYLLRLVQLLKTGHYDIVHIHGNSATMAFDLWAAKRARVPVRITHTHNAAPQTALKQKILQGYLNSSVTAPAACSRKAGELLYTKPFAVITNGINCERFRFSPDARQAVRGRLNLPEKALVVGHIGRFEPQKNQSRLIRIFECLRQKRTDAYLLLCGEGADLESCKRLVRELSLQDAVLFERPTDHPEELYSAMDAFVMPSLFEGLPLVGVEAQASGLPCVLSDTITRETRILDHVRFLSLSAADEEWADAILSIPCPDRKHAADEVLKAGFDQDTVRKQIRELYGLDAAR